MVCVVWKTAVQDAVTNATFCRDSGPIIWVIQWRPPCKTSSPLSWQSDPISKTSIWWIDVWCFVFLIQGLNKCSWQFSLIFKMCWYCRALVGHNLTHDSQHLSSQTNSVSWLFTHTHTCYLTSCGFIAVCSWAQKHFSFCSFLFLEREPYRTKRSAGWQTHCTLTIC